MKAIMKSSGIALLPILLIAGCSGQPSTSAAENAVRQAIDKGNDTKLRLVSFEKTNGQASEMMGFKFYRIMFRVEIEAISNAMYSLGDPFSGRGAEIEAIDYVRPGNSLEDFRLGSQGFRPIKPGERLRLTGTAAFERLESGWSRPRLEFAVSR